MSTTTTTAPNIAQIKAHNEQAGNYFFSRKTMKFFGSKVYPTVYHGNGGTYFVTGEDNWDKTARTYSVRKYNPETGDVRSAYHGTPYHTQQYSSAAEARSAAKILALIGEPTEQPQVQA